jgi:polyhydroxyalkanoate synthesis repressor PhaR
MKPKQKIKLRRYPNRRYYDASRSQHVTLEAIFQLIRDGNAVEVTDSKTGENITSKVLTQIILEHDAPKLDALPVELLHQLIQSSEPIVRDFIDKYFNQAFAAFVESQQRIGDYVRGTMGLATPAAATWPPAMWSSFGQMVSGEPAEKAAEPDEPNNGEDDLRDTVNQLQEQVRKLQRRVDDRK